MKSCPSAAAALAGLALVIAPVFAPQIARAQAVHLDSITVAVDGSRHLLFGGEQTNYYVLYRGSALDGITNVVQAVLGAAPMTAMQDSTAQQAASFYRVLSIATNAPLDLDGDGTNDVAELLAGTDPLRPHSLVINEIDYDQVGVDSLEFVEILNTSTAPVDLNGLKLIFVNGANNLQYLVVDLAPAGMIATGQYLVVKSSGVTAAPGALTLNFAAPDSSIQNGSPDAVAIFDSVQDAIMDALSYEGSVTNGVITGAPGTYNFVEGTPLSTSVADSNSTTGSLCRIPNGMDTDDANSDWVFSTTPTPGAPNVP